MEKENNKKQKKWTEILENCTWLQAIREGMILAIPIVLLGAFCVLFKHLPLQIIEPLQRIQRDEGLNRILDTLINATMNNLSLILLISISYSYGKLKNIENKIMLPIVTICTYIAFSTDLKKETGMFIFASGWQMNAIVCAVLCSVLFVKYSELFQNRMKNAADGISPLFNLTMRSFLPAVAVIFSLLLLRIVLMLTFGVANLQEIIAKYLFYLFDGMGNTFLAAIFFVFIKQFLWFFGIHGSHVLDYTYYVEIYKDNTISGGVNITNQIFSEPFFSNFVFFGGCGTLLCMCIAILLFTKDKNSHLRHLSKYSILPIAFNINEILLFGIPVVLNPTLLVPFIAVPLIITCTTYAAMYFEWIPVVTQQIGWTVPPLISGYVGTGTFKTVLLQAINIGIGVLIYRPFVLQYESLLAEKKIKKVRELEQYIKDCEKQGIKPKLNNFSMTGILQKELKSSLRKKEIQMYYQPQVNNKGKVTGAEALLRWEIPGIGFVYPPLVIELAQEADLTEELNRYIIGTVCENVEMLKDLEEGLEFSFNISAEQLSTPMIVEDIKKITDKHTYGKHNLGLEITEQTALQSSKEVSERISKIRDMGVHIIMDDFGMGHSSLVYLKDNDFDLVKIDGTLVRNLTENGRCADIISSIMQLSDSLGFDVLAEYVETEEQKENLRSLNCNQYQGYLYSKPIPFEDLVDYISKKSEEKKK